ncbi:tripartite tricarboxylate transporter substrate binding protein [Roseomonas sp. PWR1]|uniref:Tripartite tricarboxylate transporter substrate binding protein n=1 Tax=Roseomonas nitratireducens TaxID=2820810 RepID=A0ABS4AX01_9PROT|nr:tripartite tricarboxylate transporter substrate binding protein [Neoroseomonas nitratireducens]MBP0465296.1 tripartite tricarboxylate transporter substrate binding protein [Neoroseomonas nitratireducens]
MITRRHLAALPLLAALPRPALAQDWAPTRPVRIVVGFAAGGATDISTRTLAPKLQAILGQPIVVDNRPGAGGNLATEAVVRAAPDGTTLLMGTIGALAINPTLYRSLPFNPQADLTPIAMAGSVLNVLVIPADRPWQNVADLVAAARARPDTLSYGSSGVGGAGHLAGALLDRMAGVRTVHVPYRGGGPLMTDLISGKTDFAFSTAPTALPQVEGGRLRALAVVTAQRSALLPNLPTVAETLPGYEVANWYALVGPKGLAPNIVARLNAAMRETMEDAEVRAHLARHGVEPLPGSAEDLARFIREETAKWAPIVRESGATVD